MIVDLPLPPVSLRRSVGVEDPVFFENPHGILAFGDLVPAEKYDRVFDFGCGCGRVARQMLLQSEHVPSQYYGVDLFEPSISWCRENLTAVNPNFQFDHVDVYNAQLNPGGTAQAPVPTDQKFSLVNAHSVFTHILERNLRFYFSECVRLMEPGAYMRATWFLFDKQHFPMMQTFQNCLYINDEDCTNATIYDLNFVQALYREFDQRIVTVKRPGIRGHQWVIISANEAGPDIEFPVDDADFGLARPPVQM
jgi:SAM-dependent methyltransferase